LRNTGGDTGTDTDPDTVPDPLSARSMIRFHWKVNGGVW